MITGSTALIPVRGDNTMQSKSYRYRTPCGTIQITIAEGDPKFQIFFGKNGRCTKVIAMGITEMLNRIDGVAKLLEVGEGLVESTCSHGSGDTKDKRSCMDAIGQCIIEHYKTDESE